MIKNDVLMKDYYRVFDKLEKQIHHKRGPVGWVQIFLQTKFGLVYDEGYNLVVAKGCEFIAQRAFNSNLYSGGSRIDWTEYSVSHFAVGSGGSVVAGSPPVVTLNGPYICDTQLIEATSLDKISYLTEPSGTTLCVKPITADGGSFLLEPSNYSSLGGSCSYYTKVRCVCNVSDEEPISLPSGGTTKIDEAGLYFTSGETANLFAHICFAPKWKEKESPFTLIWYILF
ncbi:MAG: hypothetical protein PHD05_01240 [Sphaerochaetaceae bacterium]|nr:hypothetical protein [Sphaerochaetaceae bacterium]